MAELRVDIDSRALDRRATVRVVLPDVAPPPGGHPTLYLVHGIDDDGTAWLRRSTIAGDATARGLALVIPPIGESFATDEAYGQRYWTFLSEEVPALLSGRVPLSTRREDTAVAGVSMGGYAAMKWALRQPERFAAAVSLSGSLDIADPGRYRRRPELMHRLFGGQPLPGTPNDLFWLLRQLDGRGGPLPDLYVACGEGDPHLEEARRFLAACADVAGLSVTARFGAGGHDWTYWQGLVDDVVGWLAARVATPPPRRRTGWLRRRARR